LRPTIETLFGLQPRVCAGCGESFIAPAGGDSAKIAAASTDLQR